jgi:dehydrogenase/reductase SDR family protein 12
MRNIKDFLLDTSIYFSFDQSGFLRHAKSFEEIPQDLSGLNALITGANAGIGYETAKSLAMRNARVMMLCRNKEKSEEAYQTLKNINPLTQRYIVDMSDLDSIAQLSIELPTSEKIHCIIQNAGLMPQQYAQNKQGLETCLATHIIGPIALLKKLHKDQRIDQHTKNIFVSSGGGYTKKLDCAAMFDYSEERREKYDGMQAYAYTKRAQMVLNRIINEKALFDVRSYCMHPGWASTDGVKNAMPQFFDFTQQRLRTPAQGADTVIYLASRYQEDLDTDGIWFDRVLRNDYLLWGTKETQAQREEFFLRIEEILNTNG